jgi:hypothetical protein
MHLLARDPHWLYAYWELPGEDQRQHNALSADHHLIVRVHPETLDAQPVSVAHVHPESQHWFIYVDQAGKPYVAQLGYFLPDRKWVTLATSPVAVTPPDAVSPSTVLQFATIPFDVPLWQLAGAAPNVDQGKEMQAVAARTPVAAGTTATPFERAGRRNAWFPELAQLPGGESFPNIPSWFKTRPGSEVWTLAQAQALAEALRQTDRERARMNSAAIADLIRGAVKMPLPAIDVGGLGLSSPWGVAAPAGFWFRVNAELTVYGAPIQLGSDGTFCLRFALPDGQHGLALAAVSSGGDRRQATLRFSRSSEYEADVGVEPRSAVGE